MRANIPHWPRERLLREACIAWNLRHLETESPLRPDNPDWDLLVNAVYAFCRHQFSDYDHIVTPETREELRNAIAAQARRLYPWLVGAIDPRTSSPKDDAPKNRDKYFVALSKRNATFITARAQLVQALRGTRGTERETLQAKVKELDRDSADTLRQFQAATQGYTTEWGEKAILLCWGRSDGVLKYWYVDRNLSQSHLRIFDFNCPGCSQRVTGSKCAVDLGAGIRLYVFSCHCLTLAANLKTTTLKGWELMVEAQNESPDENQKPTLCKNDIS